MKLWINIQAVYCFIIIAQKRNLNVNKGIIACTE